MKEKVDVTGVPETMLQTLYARAKETKKSEMSWPVETVSGKMFYLDGAHCKTTDAAAENPEEKGACGTGDSCGNGVLTVTIPQKDGMDEYDYDPEKSGPCISSICPKMSWKYRKITQRKKNGRIF